MQPTNNKENKDVIEASLSLAKTLQYKINSDLSCKEKRFRKKMMKMLTNPSSKIMLIELLDRSFRSKNNEMVHELISHTLQKYGIADFFSSFEKVLLQLFLGIGKSMPCVSVPFFIKNLKKDTKAMVLDDSPFSLKKHSDKRRVEGIGLNVNFIGEEVLGNLESNYRLQKYEDALNSSYINYISIKITTIFSQINILDFEYSKNEIVSRLDKLYSIVEEKQKDGISKFINLDMEEFKDLELTVAAFMESLAKFNIKAGIVLQAYLPDSYDYLKTLVAFSKERVQVGKPPIKIRIVKGANMEAEETIASVKGWELPTFRRKVDTDSNYNKMLEYILQDSNFKYVDIGIASHNIFQIAYAMIKINKAEAQDSFTFEMLEGMNLKASFEVASRNKLILYAPVCNDTHFNNAIAYLVRRLDENTGKDNFMRYAFDLDIDSTAWKQQEEIFLQSIEGMQNVQDVSFRQQNRFKAPFTKEANLISFFNEPDTDFILKANREWAEAIKTKWLNIETIEVTPIIGDKTPKDNKKEIKQKGGDKVIANVYLASKNSLKIAMQYVKQAQNILSYEKLGEILLKTAEIVAERRNDLIGISALEVGKTFAETDSEVSEAIDFLRFYPHSMYKLLETHKDYIIKPKGVGVVITPWNFPVAISVGGIAASLASGNRVIYKPSNISAVTGSILTQCFYDAGLPKDYLVFLPSSGKDVNEILLKEADFAILTGGEDTAYEILRENPTLFLSAETGGKNATIVSKMADRDQAVKNIIHSAFSNSGQKCSATSLLILEEEIYKDEQFKRTLIDAAQSLNVGDPFDFKNKLGYLSSTIDGKVKQGLELEDGEEWVLAPSFENENPYAMRPCIKYGVKEGSYSHKNEFFTPILSVMCAKDLEHAINIANSTGYGLTSGFESLDEREWDYYLKHIEAGNLYINKSTTGAIVLRQPFGGIKKSAVGFGRKAGSYNYVSQFVDIITNEIQEKIDLNVRHSFIDSMQYLINTTQDEKINNELKDFLQIAKSYAYFYENEFLQKRDFVHIRGEDNLFYYTPVKSVIYRARKEDSLSNILSIIASTQMINAKLTISLKATEISESLGFVLEHIKPLQLKNITIEYENLERFIDSAGQYELIRYLATPNNENLNEDSVYKELVGQGRAKGKLIANHKPYANGYFELLFYHTECVASIAFHRYGNLGRRVLSFDMK